MEDDISKDMEERYNRKNHEEYDEEKVDEERDDEEKHRDVDWDQFVSEIIYKFSDPNNGDAYKGDSDWNSDIYAFTHWKDY